MSRLTAHWHQMISNACFGLLPAIPYAPTDDAACQGVAINAHNLAVAPAPGSPLAFSSANFEIPCGCRTALIGANGSGKSTLLRALAGLTPIASGEVKVLGAKPSLGRSRIAYLAQKPSFNQDAPLLLRRLVQMGTYSHHGWFEECEHSDAAVDRALSRLGLLELSERSVHTLSGGQLQRGLLARATVQGAELLLLDEPFAALDQTSREIVESFLFNPDNSFTVVMATHDPADSQRFDRVLELKNGQLTTVHACAGHNHRHA